VCCWTLCGFKCVEHFWTFCLLMSGWWLNLFYCSVISILVVVWALRTEFVILLCDINLAKRGAEEQSTRGGSAAQQAIGTGAHSVKKICTECLCAPSASLNTRYIQSPYTECFLSPSGRRVLHSVPFVPSVYLAPSVSSKTLGTVYPECCLLGVETR
jgi:hypothetical protein